MNTKHMITDKDYYLCDGEKVRFIEDEGTIWLVGDYKNPGTGIKDLYIPNTINGKPVDTIEGEIIDYKKDLRSFIVEDDNEYFRLYEGGLYSNDMTKMYFMPPKFEGRVFFVPKGVKLICDTAIFVNTLETLVIPEGCTRMIEYSAAVLKNLKRVYIPKSMEFIGFKAFNFTAPNDVFYEGSEEDKAKIDFCDEGFNAGLLNAKWHYNCTIPKSSDEIK
ncbi:MAG: hypothetical protein K6F71_11925 [Ruminococcus sp.]|uniref:hypothetical protein n=1 Tax=Ruminococcus sp. TaxID=41978 RepID=UPI0025F39043|nr:hypothetical protein [Ruminococcus sp.]MCR5541504.1 hypothetical protein [Ruminococcus sp.]